MGGREPGRLASLAAGGLIDRSRSTQGAALGGPPLAFGGADMSEHVRMWIGGEWVDAEDGATFDAISPSTGEVVGTVPEGTRADASRAISAAQAAWPAWAGLSAFGRHETRGRGDRRTS